MTSPKPPRRPRAGPIALLTVFGPISLDLYLPALPQLADELSISATQAQLTLTVCMVGLALGQIVAGPLSDRFGRRPPMLIGVAGFAVISLLCAVAPNLPLLLVLRFAQGLGGACGVVIAQAIGRDLYEGPKLVTFYGRLAVLGGLAAVVGPTLGGQLTAITDWRGIFVVLGGIGAAIFVVSLLLLPETLAPEHRHQGGIAARFHGFVPLLRDPLYRGAVLASGLTNAALFAYLSGAPFILQRIYGLTPQAYALAFALNSLAFALAGYSAGRLTRRFNSVTVIRLGLSVSGAGALGITATAIASLPLAAMMMSLLVMVAGIALVSPPFTSLALNNYPHMAGTASSLLGLGRYAFGAAAAPLVGLAGEASALPLGIVTVVATALAIVIFRAVSAHITPPAAASSA